MPSGATGRRRRRRRWLTEDRRGAGARLVRVRRRRQRAAVEEVAHLRHRPAVVRDLGHGVLEQRTQPAGVGQAGRVLVDDPVEGSHHVVADLVRRPAAQGVEGGGTQRPHVGGRRSHLSRGHLGREVAGGAGDQAGLGQRGVRLGPSDAEVGELHLPLGRHQDVRGLHVAVHDAGLVRGCERVGGLAQQRCGLVRRQGAVLPDQLGERASLDVLHHQPVLGALVHEVEDRDHVRVVEPRREPGLPLGALEVGGADAGGHAAEALERDLPPEHLVGAEPDGAHATAADLAVDGVPACDLHRLPSGPSASVLSQAGHPAHP